MAILVHLAPFDIRTHIDATSLLYVWVCVTIEQKKKILNKTILSCSLNWIEALIKYLLSLSILLTNKITTFDKKTTCDYIKVFLITKIPINFL